MCGILGTVPATDKTLFKRSLDTLYHRGPDAYGIESFGDEVSLGHRRLSILDLSENGRQPMLDKSERYAVVFNGEIYNFLEIKKELEKKGHTFKSTSDTEVLLYAFIEYGPQCVKKFNGMWALAIWDKEKKELFLSRDRYGKKPMFYSFVNGKFIFASEMKAIYPFLDRLEISKDFHWCKNNIFAYENTDKCLIEGIKRFPFGHNGWFRNGKLTTERYWNTLDTLVEVPKSYGEQVERFRELFFESCKLRMRSDVTIGTALSGGLDSSCTISAMANLAKNNQSFAKDWQHAFVATFPGTPLDESYYAKKVTDHIGIQGTFININPLEHWNKLEEYFYLFEDLYLTSPIPMIATYGAVKKHGVTVTLDGHGADEMFSGYGHLLEALWDSKFNPKSTLDVLRTYQDTQKENSQYYHDSVLKLYLKYIIPKIGKTVLGKKHKSNDRDHKNFRQMDNFSRSLYSLFHETILPTLLRNYDRYAMINSVEIRMPFMDHRLVSYVFSLPYSSKFGGGYTKKLVRDAIDPYLPKEVTWRKSKIGFNSPTVDWMQNELKEWFLDTVHGKDFETSALLDNPLELRQKITNVAQKKNNNLSYAQNCWNELTPFIWEKSVLKRP